MIHLQGGGGGGGGESGDSDDDGMDDDSLSDWNLSMYKSFCHTFPHLYDSWKMDF